MIFRVKVPCQICKVPVKTEDLLEHFETNHPKLKCEQCRKDFFKSRFLKLHNLKANDNLHSCEMLENASELSSNNSEDLKRYLTSIHDLRDTKLSL